MSTVKAIETHYAGCRFRSRLEARWAVFFDALGIPWQYEPEGYELPSGRYLPDFWLPQQRTFYEIKGQRPTEHELRLGEELAELAQASFVIAWGDLPNGPDIAGFDYSSKPGGIGARGIWTHLDIDYAWTVCPNREHYGITYEARGDRLGCCPTANESDRGHRGNFHRITAAYDTARSARFEHGETPRPAPPARNSGVMAAREALRRARHSEATR